MLTMSIIFFTLAIFLGLSMAAMHFKKVNIPLFLGFSHGFMATVGLVLLLIVVFGQVRAGLMAISAGVLTTAAVGGLSLISYPLRGRTLPTGLLFLHALLALMGYFLLLAVVLTPP